jgi:hypothetical protein
MAEPLHLRPDAALEDALRGLAEAIDWPAAGPAPSGGPDLAAVVRSRIEAAGPAGTSAGASTDESRSHWSWRPARRALVVAVIVLLALAALAGAASLGLPGLRLILGPAPVSPPPSLEPSRSPAAGPPGAKLGLGTRVDLADLDAQAGFAVTWPTDPALGPPDAAYVDRSKGGQVSLVWADRPGLPETLEPGVGLLLTAFKGQVDQGMYSKVINMGTTVRVVLVDGGRAFWLSGDPHFFFYEGPGGQVHDDRRWVGDTLIWADGPITYRLETSLGSERSIEIAESMP